MRILIPGGSGQVGTILARYFHAAGHHVTVLSRTPPAKTSPAPWHTAHWDGLTLSPSWTDLLETSDAVIHLSGRSVNCRYTPENRRQILDSRVLPTRLLGEAIAQCANPPAVWLNASTSTFYRDASGSENDPAAQPNDEFTGVLGGNEPDTPDSWDFSIEVARRWEQAFYATPLAHTRRIALRTSLTMSPDPGGVFAVLLRLVRFGLGGAQGTGKQFVSWIHDRDYARAVDFLLTNPRGIALAGPVNFTAPEPLPNRDFLHALRQAWGAPIGLPAYTWMLEVGAIFLRTETELILKSRRAIPTVLLRAGFLFDFPTWPPAAQDLVNRTRATNKP